MQKNILIAGIGGASLGTEIFKNLQLAGYTRIYGTDISPYAFGLYQDGFLKTYLADTDKYIQDILNLCVQERIDVVIPGGESPLTLLNQHRALFYEKGVLLAMNSEKVIKLCTDKLRLFAYLQKNGIPAPKTVEITNEAILKDLPYPGILKPSKDSGGSVFVSVVHDAKEAQMLADQMMKSGRQPLFQEYLPVTEGEYSFSVLSAPSGELFGGIGIKKNFDAKLMYTFKSDTALISSGYSHGFISGFPELFSQVSRIAKVLESRGPINIEGRVVNGQFFPFEINPRFSATTHLWAMAGFNDVDYCIRLFSDTPISEKPSIREGFYLRSLTEKFIPKENIKKQINE